MPTPRVERQDTKAQRKLRASSAALAKNAFAPDSMAIARDAKLAMFERVVDPLELLDVEERRRRGHRLFRSWMGDVAYNASRKRRGQSYRDLILADWLANVTKKAAATAHAATAEETRDATATAPDPS